MKKKEPKTTVQIRHCAKCINGCALDKPMCCTGRELAEKDGIYETVPVKKRNLFQIIKKKYKSL